MNILIASASFFGCLFFLVDVVRLLEADKGPLKTFLGASFWAELINYICCGGLKKLSGQVAEDIRVRKPQELG